MPPACLLRRRNARQDRHVTLFIHEAGYETARWRGQSFPWMSAESRPWNDAFISMVRRDRLEGIGSRRRVNHGS